MQMRMCMFCHNPPLFVVLLALIDIIEIWFIVSGVADGVGGWRNYGVDPSTFPRTLMSVCERLVVEGHFTPQAPGSIIAAGYDEMLERKIPAIG